jgi:hypothetical protein
MTDKEVLERKIDLKEQLIRLIEVEVLASHKRRFPLSLYTADNRRCDYKNHVKRPDLF